MNEFNGIPVNEWKLLVLTVIFSVVAIALIALGIFWLRNVLEAPDRSTRRRIEAIRSRGADDPQTIKRLKKLERKQKKQQKERWKTLINDGMIGLIIAAALAIDLIWCVVPGWSDYIEKDYLIYEGEFEVETQVRHDYIILEDGTRISGSLGLAKGTHEGTLVYTKRTEIALGAD